MLLFITRKYPPSIGGMQEVNVQLYEHLKQKTRVHLAAWGGSQLWLPLVLPYLFFKSLWTVILSPDIKVIFLGDALLMPLGYLLKLLSRKKIVVMAHGLDITWTFPLYQSMVRSHLKAMDKIVCVSQQTKDECLRRNAQADHVSVIPNGIVVNGHQAQECSLQDTKSLEDSLGIDLKKSKLILSVGRLVERKGFHSFVANIFPKIQAVVSDAVYVIVGKGAFKKQILNTVKDRKMENQVILLDKVSRKMLYSLYSSADVFVMPNIPVEGDMEGFGIVVLEAGIRGAPVVASAVDGLKDAIKDGENGILVKYNDYEHFAGSVSKLLNDTNERNGLVEKTKSYIQKQYSWETISGRYLEEFKQLLQK